MLVPPFWVYHHSLPQVLEPRFHMWRLSGTDNPPLVPTDRSLTPASRRGLKWKPKRAPLTIQQIVQETNIIIVQDNQAELDALQRLAEQQFAQLVQAEVALITQLEAVKNNIRVNHFKARFSQVVSRYHRTKLR